MKGSNKMKSLFFVFVGSLGLSAQAMPIKSQMIKPRAFFQEAENNLFEPLDLKAKTLSFGKAELDQCGANLSRRGQTLTFSCSLPIPTTARISKLQKLVNPKAKEIKFGGTKRTVLISINEDEARHQITQITLSTAFDATGIDFEVSKFNDDFYAVYAKVAHLVISEALKEPVRLEVLESR